MAYRDIFAEVWQKLNLIEFVKAKMIWTMDIKVQNWLQGLFF